MSRRRLSVAALLAVSLAAVPSLGCSEGSEDAILTHFFTASRLRDNTTLGSFATADFDPRARGIVTSFTITSVGAEQRRPLAPRAVAEKDIVELSAVEPGQTLDVTKYDGDLVWKDVTIDAPVRMPDGQTVRKTLVITLQRAELKAGNKPIVGRWIVAAIKERSAQGGTKTS